ncbi:hypothetical protein N480_00170 [Pseudoalteromonas luteoviolacea S2607]|uniref:hypothetical protein n=1 Tax=Pseudoalteromonas luteoviolacea TaxID=43657 RepID=UPI0007B16FA9|nr:hypothetical protein [Pseudoalteromonas luteoviolacea]KZN39275.1 hypothetical protein N480_00170 [Pseudoalteromonas luteoviolacea S2607]
MRNQTVTQNEFEFAEGIRLNSSTNTRGVITHCNDEFVEVSEFCKEELISHNHTSITFI